MTTRRLAQCIALEDGARIPLCHDTVEVCSPDGEHRIYFHWITQPPHGDSCFQLLSEGRVLPGLIWGVSAFWSPSRRYFSGDWTGYSDSDLARRAVLVDLQRWTYIDLGPFFAVQRLSDEALAGKDVGGNVVRLPLDNDQWQSALHSERRR